MEHLEMSTPENLHDLIFTRNDHQPAIGGDQSKDLTYEFLKKQISRSAASLHSYGVERGDRVAIVLKNGPRLATVFLTVACYTTAAPLNPGYRKDEFHYYLTDLKARILIVDADDPQTDAVAAASDAGIPVVRVRASDSGAAGEFEFDFDAVGAIRIQAGEGNSAWGGPDDVALVLHTSGTTSRPKIVPLTHRNIVTSAYNIASGLALAKDDRALLVMPLFHIHGLIGALLAPLAVGSFAYCCAGFNALGFLAELEKSRASWYSAVPTMHQAVLARASKNADRFARLGLRFVRSSSSSLSTTVLRELEGIFRCPVIEAYGMTEAAHQMCSNSLAARKPGTVGTPTGIQLDIIDESGKSLPAGQRGEIVIKGPSVTRGYENNPAANAQSFVEGWFKTGDLGTVDHEGYLTVNGRLKEIISRGGEKISPLEVDEVIMSHKAVAQAVTFAVPHDLLGEEIFAVVVLHEGAATTTLELRNFVAERAASFKVPKRILIVGEIPKGPTGKVQRIGLAKQLGLIKVHEAAGFAPVLPDTISH
jgi:acyl-CoA synthetase (AMP-forming)/AMP-acid ligase II